MKWQVGTGGNSKLVIESHKGNPVSTASTCSKAVRFEFVKVLLVDTLLYTGCFTGSTHKKYGLNKNVFV